MVVKKAAVSTRVEKNRDKVLKLSKGDMYLPLDTLIQDRNIYPRRNIVENKVNAYADALKVGVVFPAIIVESKNERPTGRIFINRN
jgi:predicted metalloendopeptidase